jgi:hypothetical protein
MTSSGRFAQRPEAPPAQRVQDGLQLAAVWRQLVDHGRSRAREQAPLDHASLLELPQPRREDVAGDRRQSLAEIGEALGSEQEISTLVAPDVLAPVLKSLLIFR